MCYTAPMPKKRTNRAPFTETQVGQVRWFDVAGPTLPQLKALQERFPSLLDADLQDCMPPFQRPKLLERFDHLFLVLIFPVYDEKTDSIRPYEVDFFIGKDFVATVHAGTHQVLRDLRDHCTDGDSCPVAVNDDGLAFTLETVHRLIVACYPLVTSVSNRLVGMEDLLFSDSNDALVKEMLRARSNIVTFRKAIQGYEHTVRKLGVRSKKLFPLADITNRLEDIAGHGREIWSFLENDKETVDALYDSHLAFVNFRTSEASRKLAALAFVVLPMTLVAAVFTTHATGGMLFVDGPYGFWIVNGLILLTGIILFAYLGKKKWL